MKSHPIPISAARKIAETFSCDQVVIIARRVGPGGGEQCTTYGRTKEHCTIAARMGERLQAGVMGWPGVLHPDAAGIAFEYASALDDDRRAMHFLGLWWAQDWDGIQDMFDSLPANMLPVSDG